MVELGLPAQPVADPELVDEVAVDRACAGEAVRLSEAERREAVRRLVGRGLLPAQAGDRLGMSYACVQAALADGEVAA